MYTVCVEYNHVRSWSITRFRGYLSTQPGSVPLASFKIVALDEFDPVGSYVAGNDIGMTTVHLYLYRLLRSLIISLITVNCNAT